MMDLFTAIAKRHSYRGDYRTTPVPRADLEKIVNAGIQAPSGCNAQSTTFVVVDDGDKLVGIKAVLDKPFVQTAPAFIVCLADPTPVYGDNAFEREDCAAAVENMLLAITALGYASVWLDGFLRSEGRAEKIGQLLGVPAPRKVQVVLPVGVPVAAGEPREKKPFAERVRFNTY